MAPLNYNVRLALWWSVFENASASLRSGDVLSGYLFVLTKSQSVVGFVQGVNGILQLLAAIPAGVLADRYRRDTMLRAGAAVGTLAGLFMAWTLAFHPSVWSLTAAMAMFGCYRGVYSAALEALFADSVARGRSSPYSWRFVVTLLAASIGPWVSCLLFWRLGNTWTAPECRLVLLAGLAIMLPAILLMCSFNDDKALTHHQPKRQQQTCNGSVAEAAVAAAQAAPAANGSDAAVHESANGGVVAAAAAAAAGSSGHGATAEDAGPLCSAPDNKRNGLPGVFGWHPAVVVTALIGVSDFTGALASGMTVKFFALFFLEACHMRPIGVSMLGAVSPMVIALASLAAQRVSKVGVGRVQISLVTRLLDILLLVALARLPTSAGSARHVLVAVHLSRTALANCSRALMRSVLMDNVAKQYRGQVNALESIRMFSWSGSAALGGLLIERFGYSTTFLITAAIKTLSFLPLTLLLAYVPDGICAGGRELGYEPLAQDEEAGEAGQAAGEEELPYSRPRTAAVAQPAAALAAVAAGQACQELNGSAAGAAASPAMPNG